MLTIPGPRALFCDGLRRRNFLTLGGLALGGLGLPQWLRAEGRTEPRATHRGIIMVLLPGGPPHLDMYDLKPDAPAEIRGEFSPISTSVPGIEICELLPRMAARMDRLVPIRTLVGARDEHTTHQCVTGWDSHPPLVNIGAVPGSPPGGWPSLGAVLSRVHGAAAPGVPASVDLTPTYYDSRFATNGAPGHPGYLGVAHAAFEVDAVDRRNILLDGTSLDRLSDRRALLSRFDRFRRAVDSDGLMQGLDSYTRQAFEVLTSPRLAEALDLDREDPRLRALYGLCDDRTPRRGGGAMLEQFLIARRVIEAGARCVTLCFSRWPFGRMARGDYNWDWHRDNFAECRATLPLLDQGVSALVDDLEQRGLLGDVAVVVWGEFGRTPKINSTAGRDHWPAVGGALLAGGGLRTGQTLGVTDRYGEAPRDRPVHFRDVFATLYHQLGVDTARTQFTDLAGRPHYLLDDRRPLAELV